MLQLAAAVVVHGSSTTELFEGRPVLAWKLWCAWLRDQAPGENAGGRGYFCMSEKKIPRGFNQKCSNWKGSISQQSLAAGPRAGARYLVPLLPAPGWSWSSPAPAFGCLVPWFASAKSPSASDARGSWLLF